METRGHGNAGKKIVIPEIAPTEGLSGIQRGLPLPCKNAGLVMIQTTGLRVFALDDTDGKKFRNKNHCLPLLGSWISCPPRLVDRRRRRRTDLGLNLRSEI